LIRCTLIQALSATNGTMIADDLFNTFDQVWFSNRRARWRKQVGSQQLQNSIGSSFSSFPGSSSTSMATNSATVAGNGSFVGLSASAAQHLPQASQSLSGGVSLPMSSNGAYFPFASDQPMYPPLGKRSTHSIPFSFVSPSPKTLTATHTTFDCVRPSSLKGQSGATCSTGWESLKPDYGHGSAVPVSSINSNTSGPSTHASSHNNNNNNHNSYLLNAHKLSSSAVDLQHLHLTSNNHLSTPCTSNYSNYMSQTSDCDSPPNASLHSCVASGASLPVSSSNVYTTSDVNLMASLNHSPTTAASTPFTVSPMQSLHHSVNLASQAPTSLSMPTCSTSSVSAISSFAMTSAPTAAPVFSTLGSSLIHGSNQPTASGLCALYTPPSVGFTTANLIHSQSSGMLPMAGNSASSAASSMLMIDHSPSVMNGYAMHAAAAANFDYFNSIGMMNSSGNTLTSGLNDLNESNGDLKTDQGQLGVQQTSSNMCT
jgi:hypothetical protein